MGTTIVAKTAIKLRQKEIKMSSFTSPLVVKHLDGEKWEVMRKFTYHVGNKTSKEMITVPVGFITDFASIPRTCWSLIGSPTGKYGKAAVLHDYLYRRLQRKYSRKQSDDIFLEAMKISKVGMIRRYTIYYSVRLFGFASWRKK